MVELMTLLRSPLFVLGEHTQAYHATLEVGHPSKKDAFW